MRPADFKYTETHEWIKVNDKKKEATVGITDYAVEQLSDLVHIELPKVGANCEQGAGFGEIESVKTVADLLSPLTGKILEVNKAIADRLDSLKEDPFEEGWLIKIKFTDPGELTSLMTSKEYGEFLESQKAETEDDEEKKKEEGSEEDVDEDDFM